MTSATVLAMTNYAAMRMEAALEVKVVREPSIAGLAALDAMGRVTSYDYIHAVTVDSVAADMQFERLFVEETTSLWLS